MVNKHAGRQSFTLKQNVVIQGWSSVVGKKESEGPLGGYFTKVINDSYMNKKTWEQSEIQLQKMSLEALLEKTRKSRENIGAVISGDLLNQCISSSSSLSNMNIPHLGLYGACSTMAESLLVGAMVLDGGYYENVVAITSSHFASSERQFRFPLDYGGQRPPTSQWTVTGSGAILLGCTGNGPKITACTTGTVVDFGITDANNMGAAMAPAAFSTIKAHLTDLNENLDNFDLIVTGDLGAVGVEALIKLSIANGMDLSGKIFDCGVEIFDRKTQDVHAGGSGCGCSAVVLCGKLLDLLNTGRLKRILFCGTGALLSPTSVQQGLSIPGICHAVAIEGV